MILEQHHILIDFLYNSLLLTEPDYIRWLLPSTSSSFVLTKSSCSLLLKIIAFRWFIVIFKSHDLFNYWHSGYCQWALWARGNRWVKACHLRWTCTSKFCQRWPRWTFIRIFVKSHGLIFTPTNIVIFISACICVCRSIACTIRKQILLFNLLCRKINWWYRMLLLLWVTLLHLPFLT